MEKEWESEESSQIQVQDLSASQKVPVWLSFLCCVQVWRARMTQNRSRAALQCLGVMWFALPQTSFPFIYQMLVLFQRPAIHKHTNWTNISTRFEFPNATRKGPRLADGHVAWMRAVGSLRNEGHEGRHQGLPRIQFSNGPSKGMSGMPTEWEQI